MKSSHARLAFLLTLLLMISFSSCQQETEDKNDTETVEDDPQDSPCLPPLESTITQDMVDTWVHNQDSLIDSAPDQFANWPANFQIDMSLIKSQVDTLLHSHFRLYYGLICSAQDEVAVLLFTPLPIDCSSTLHTGHDSVVVLLPYGIDVSGCGITAPVIKVSYDDALLWTDSWRTYNGIDVDNDLRTVNGTEYKIPLAFNFNYKQFCSALDTAQSILAIEPGLMKVDTVSNNLYEYKLILDDDLNQPSAADYLDFASPCPRHCGNYSDPLL